MAVQGSTSGLPRRTQKTCCYTSAIDADATFCGDCGKPLIRCMAAEECGGLLDDQGLCTVCVSPHLQVDAGALTAAKVGGAVAIPVSIMNASVVGRPIFVTNLWSRQASGEWREEALTWERLEAGQSRPVMITADQLTRAGAHSIEILVALSSRWRWRQESYAFSAALQLNIESETSKNGPVVTLGGESAGHGNTVYISGQTDQRAAREISTKALSLVMIRAEKEEHRFGMRGLSENLWLPKSSRLSWKGFPKQDTLSDGPILTSDGILAVGRMRSRRSGGMGDIRLLVEDSDGVIDEEASRHLSRRHFELYVECNRLTLRVTGSGGLRINGDAYGSGKVIILQDGDRIEPLVKAPKALALGVKFNSQHGSIHEVIFTRSPAIHRGE